jgi:hypothetical protein
MLARFIAITTRPKDSITGGMIPCHVYDVSSFDFVRHLYTCHASGVSILAHTIRDVVRFFTIFQQNARLQLGPVLFANPGELEFGFFIHIFFRVRSNPIRGATFIASHPRNNPKRRRREMFITLRPHNNPELSGATTIPHLN